jgi:hypothetical protein
LMFLLDNGADLVECFLIILLLSDSLLIFEMLPLETFTVFLVGYALLLAHFKSVGDFLNQQLEGVGNITLPCGTFQVSPILNFPLIILKERVIHLYSLYPDCRLRGGRDTAAIYFSADLFCPPHVRLPFFVDIDNLLRPFFN